MSKKKIELKNTIYYPDRCTFYVDTNNLISYPMIKNILDKFTDITINRLNECINGIKVYIGGHHWHYKKRGFLKFSCYEFNFNDKTLLIFLSKIFKLGYERWSGIIYGGLRRYIWESFCHEFIMSIIHILRLDLSLIDKAKDIYLNRELNREVDMVVQLVNQLFSFYGEAYNRIDFISINSELWHEPIPKSLGFLNVLYNRKLESLKKKINTPRAYNYDKIKFFNEIRKIKLKYEYEYNFSELVNYCINNDYFEVFFRYNWEIYGKLQREFYNKAKRIILKFFEQYNITHELKKYKDSANRTHIFLTHKTFERVKSTCLQTCIANLKNKFLENYTNFRIFYSKCPICKKEDINRLNCERFYFSSKYSYFKSILIEKINEFESLKDINIDDDYFFGIPCDECFRIVRNIQGRYYELNQMNKFMVRYGTCPICNHRNHRNFILSFYHNKDDKVKVLRDSLIQNMDLSKKMKRYEVNIGIPCCNCFKDIFDEEPLNFDITFI